MLEHSSEAPLSWKNKNPFPYFCHL